ncbi:parallel beta helix pectate lyase-like protein [Hydrogenispora ethanolica]|uniref:Parallel beta helix pectate lyase-like protein n=1 Tax=Hydrogenispora ethanolica TaxID=1082276 RepID=A0A4V2QBR3_HYDET|nr:right-handed parallel beta-helix repeat-containing protein [Hydrogenispora ethanolica]TCL57462.1 parallel beta helix pectate lyase-like protein [Hydrogenispora ethanolica]
MKYGIRKSLSILLFFIMAACLTLVAVNNTYAEQTATGHSGKIITVKQHGSADYRTISAAVNAARPGDTIIVHEGTYRETVTFPRGGNDETSRITLKAADGENVIVKGSDVATGWEPYSGDTYKLVKANSYFGDFNPFNTVWPTRPISCGNVYINDRELAQQTSISNVQNNAKTWYAIVDGSNTTVYANFSGLDPNRNRAEIHVRKQVINAAWNQGYITIDGLTVMHGCAPKGQGYWKPESVATMSIPMDGAIATTGGHHWIIQNCTVKNNRGVAIDFGLGAQRKEAANGGTPAVYGYHKILNNVVRDNGTNGIMAYKGAYTEIAGNKLINNNALNTTLLSEAFVKDVDGGEGIYIHHNYFYSNQTWKTMPIWLDSECNNCRVSENVFAGPGLSYVMYEANHGYNLMDNNVFIGVGINMYESSHTYMVHNLFLGIGNNNNFVNPKRITGTPETAEGWDGVCRTMSLHVPDTLTSLGRYETRYRFNKMFNNIFYTNGPIAEATEPAAYEPTWSVYQPNVTTFVGTYIWGNECDYNVYYNGAQKINNYASAHNYTPDAHSAVVSGNTYTYSADENSCEITINIDPNNIPANLGAPKMTGFYLGPHELYKTLGYDVIAPDVITDFFGNERKGGVVVGPFSQLHPGSNQFKLWPIGR